MTDEQTKREDGGRLDEAPQYRKLCYRLVVAYHMQVHSLVGDTFEHCNQPFCVAWRQLELLRDGKPANPEPTRISG